VFPVRFDRFSPYFNHAREYNLDLHPMAHYALTYPFDSGTLINLAYYFEDHNVGTDYFVAMVESLGKLRVVVSKWRDMWKRTSSDAWVSPKLYFLDDTDGEIIDSRSGKTLRLSVGANGRRLLESLYKPKATSILVREFPTISVEAEMENLLAKGLIFREGERSVGLVCPGNPPPMPER
jgi:hypothetical protein